MQKQPYYITTPIYYPSDKLHIGHTYCTVAADTMARYKRLRGCDVMFLTGTDEHGQKIEEKARDAGVSPQEFVDNIVAGRGGILDLWKLMNISNDRFIRTTDDYHVEAIQKIFRKMYEKGDIYKGSYEGLYCTPCESFWTQSQLKDGKCPDCGREVSPAVEEAYFFRLSKYAGRVRDLLVNTDFLAHEMGVARPKTLDVVIAIVEVAERGKVVKERVHPDVDDVSGVEVHRYAPCEAGSRDAEILKPGVDEVIYHLVDAGARLKEIGVYKQVAHPAGVF
jgi:leucyl-tRNA synthetase